VEGWRFGERSDRETGIELLAGIRRNELNALRTFVLRFEPVLLDQARRLSVSPGDRGTIVTGFLDDILVKLANTNAESPRSLTAFVIASFRNCVIDLHREAAVRERHARSEEEAIGTEYVVRATCSEFMLRAARANGDDEESSSAAAARLVHVLLDGCSSDERQLLVWSAHRVPLRECAAWLGIGYDAAKQKLSRLRARLVRDSITHLSSLADSDRRELSRLLSRAGIRINNEGMRSTA
jgi:DNA-directed RNA polymerase specialized sigma24 family protein